jgi:peptidase E
LLKIRVANSKHNKCMPVCVAGGWSRDAAIWAGKTYTLEVRGAHKQLEVAVEQLQLGTGSAEAVMYCRAVRAVLVAGFDTNKVIVEAHNKAKKALSALW